MRTWIVRAALASALAATAAHAEAPPWETWRDFRRLALVDGRSAGRLESSRCLDGCRYDRNSTDPGRGSPRVLRIERGPDGDEAVIFDQPGAGAVTRIWMTAGDGASRPLPSGVRLRVRLDGEATPALDLPLDAYFGPAAAPAPLRSEAVLAADRLASAGGNVSYLPLPYARGAKISLLNGAGVNLWYQIGYTRLAAATPVAPFAGRAAYADLAAVLARPALHDWALQRARRLARRAPAAPDAAGQSGLLSAAAPLTLFSREGAGWLASLRVRLPRERWRDVSISFAFDGTTTVDVPLAEFFGADQDDERDPKGVLAGVDADGAFYSAIPMPFRRTAAVALRLADAAAAPVAVRWSAEADPEAPPAEAGTFGVERHAACPTVPARDGDETLFAHGGSGRLIGLAARMSGDGAQAGGYYLEGDERIYVDGSVQPLWYGTGVEDFYDGGFYFDDHPYAGPLAGATARRRGGADDGAAMYRWFLTGGPDWRRSIAFRLENGPAGASPLCLRTLAYYYARPDALQAEVAALEVGEPASVAAAGYRPGAGAACETLAAAFGDEPPTVRTASVCRGRAASRFTLDAPAPGTRFRLRRTFDAGVAGQAAGIFVGGVQVGAWGDVQANPSRRWSQDDTDIELPAAASALEFEIRPLPGRVLTESRYELWADAAAGPAPQ